MLRDLAKHSDYHFDVFWYGVLCRLPILRYLLDSGLVCGKVRTLV